MVIVRSLLRRVMANLCFRISGFPIEQESNPSVGSNIQRNFGMGMKVSVYGPGVVIMPIG
jgi:hypothetical protein